MSLLKSINTNTIGIIWLTEGAISTENKHFSEIDYLMNGQLLVTLKKTKDSPQSTPNMFITHSFKNEFFVYQQALDLDSPKNFAEKIRGLVVKDDGIKKGIVVINESKTDFISELKMAVPNIEFSTLDHE